MRTELWDGWSVDLPDGMAQRRNQDGSWSAADASHVIDIDIVETSGGPRGALSAEELLAAIEPGENRHEGHGTILLVSTKIEVTPTDEGPQPIHWTHIKAAATNTVLLMHVANLGERDAVWHEEVWRSLRHQDA